MAWTYSPGCREEVFWEVRRCEGVRHADTQSVGLSPATDNEPTDNRAYRCAEGTVFRVYSSPQHAGKSTATLAGWLVDDVERVVDELTSNGVTFERYDEGLIITDEKGIATFEGGAKVDYFKDPDGNTLSIAQAPRSRVRSEAVRSVPARLDCPER